MKKYNVALIAWVLLSVSWWSVANAKVIIGYDFSNDTYPSFAATGISGVSTYSGFRYSSIHGRELTDGNPAPCASNDTWRSVWNNYYRFQVSISDGCTLTLKNIVFNSLSEQQVTIPTRIGPDEYDVRYSTNGSSFVSISGGWQPITPDNTWYSNITANNGGTPISGLTGTVYFRIYGRGGFSDSYCWKHDNVTLNGIIASNLTSWNNSLVADFGDTNGLYAYGTAWSQLSTCGNVNQMVEWNDGATDNLVVDFGNGRGLSYYDGTVWTPMTDWDDVVGIATFGNTLAVDFGNDRGIWTYNGTWTKITGWDTANDMTGWDDGSTDHLIVDFGSGRGTYSYNGTAWNKMTSWCDVVQMTVYNNGSDDILAVDFGNGRGIFTYDGTWTKITGWNTAHDMIACGTNLAVDFGYGRGIFSYDGTWNKITNWDSANDMTAWNDGVNSNLVVDFSNNSGLKSYDGTWTTLTGWDDTIEMQGVGTTLSVDFGPGIGFYLYDGSSWTKINDWSTGD